MGAFARSSRATPWRRGDTVNTNEGRVQLRFTDEGFDSLYTRSVFRIDQYRWSGVIGVTQGAAD